MPKESFMMLRHHMRQRPYFVVLFLSALCFVVGVMGRFHFSSLGMWSSYNQVDGSVPGLIAGEPRSIRSDEWLLGTPWLLSQLNSNPPLEAKNISVGAETSALLVGLPVKHWSAVFRPAQWGFFLFSTERGFSWYWMVRSVGCFTALMILLLMLTEEALLLSFAGALWIYFSSFTQWWFASVSELLLYFSLGCITLRLIFTAANPGAMLLAGAAFLISAGGFALTLYPPFQVPLFYLGVALIPLLLRGVSLYRSSRLWYQLATLGAASLMVLCAVVLFLRDNAQAVALMENTVYPGRRLSAGGGVAGQRDFSGFFSPLWTQDDFPRHLGNISEASSFILLWPLALVSISLRTNRHFLSAIAPLGAYLGLTALWAYYGIPAWLAHVSGWELVPPSRAVVGWGTASIVFTVLVLRYAKRLAWSRVLLLTVASLGAIGFYFVSHSELQPATISVATMTLLAAGFLCAAVGISSRSPLLLLLGVLVLCAWPHSLVNPVMRGMRPILENPLVRAVTALDESRTARWIVFDSSEQAQLVKATGRKVLNGAQYLPNFWMMKKIDPSGAQRDVYNRYAHATFLVATPEAQQALYLPAPDAWHLHIDPCGQKFAQLRVDYIVITKAHPEHNLSCYEQVFSENAISIYRRR